MKLSIINKIKILQGQLEENHHYIFVRDLLDNNLTGMLKNKEKSFFKTIRNLLKEIIINKIINYIISIINNIIMKKLSIKEYIIILESQGYLSIQELKSIY
jgi:hypothetical protein